MDKPATQPSPTEVLGQWRLRGAQRLDGVGFQLLEGLARRCEALSGDARAQLEARLTAHMSAFKTRHQQSFEAAGETGQLRAPTPARAVPAARSESRDSLRALVTQLRSQAANKPDQPEGLPVAPGLGELKALHQFRDTWSRLNAERLLTDAQALVPDQAGPLNTERLIHRALQVMHTVAPGYLQHFMVSLETLDCLERAQGGAPRVGTKEPARATAAARKTPRTSRSA